MNDAGTPQLTAESEAQSPLAWLELIEWTTPLLMKARGDAILVCGQDDVPTVMDRLAKAGVRLRGKCYHAARQGWLLGIRPLDLSRAKRALKGVLVDTGRSS